MKIQLNGKPHELEAPCNVAALLDGLQIKSDVVAVEVNLNIIPKNRRAETELKEGDMVEVIRFVGGGC